MRPINLLPPYIYDKQKKRNLMAVWGAALAVVVGGFLFWNGAVQSQLDAEKEKLTTAQGFQNTYNKLNTDIQTVNAKSKETTDRITFVRDANTYNDAWSAVYNRMRNLTSPDILLRSMSVSAPPQKTVNMAGFATSEMNIVRWWTFLKNQTDVFDTVSFIMPSDQNTYAPAGAQAGGGGGFGGGMNRSPVGMGGPGGSMGSSKGGPVGFSGAPGAGFSGSPGGSAGGQGGEVGAAVVENRRGYNFTATAELKQPIAGVSAPSWPPAGGAGGAGAAPGGFPGGGSMGMPAGMPAGMPPGGSMGAMGTPRGRAQGDQ